MRRPAVRPRLPTTRSPASSRILMTYPEILGWEYHYRLGREAIGDAMYRAVKRVKPSAQVGWHVDHQPAK